MEYIQKAKTLIKNGKISDAIKILDRYTRDSHEAAHLLFEIYNDEKSGTYFDQDKATNIIQILNKEKYIPAKFDYALINFKGNSVVERDLIKAENIFREVANTKSEEDRKKYFKYITEACMYVATIYEEGLVDDIDKKEALKYYRLASKNDRLLDAKYKVGKLIVDVYPDKYVEALPYLQDAAKNNHIKSMRLLSKIYLILAKLELNKLVKIDDGSVDPQIILDKLDKIDESLL